jgi:hypothetical protein
MPTDSEIVAAELEARLSPETLNAMAKIPDADWSPLVTFLEHIVAKAPVPE